MKLKISHFASLALAAGVIAGGAGAAFAQEADQEQREAERRAQAEAERRAQAEAARGQAEAARGQAEAVRAAAEAARAQATARFRALQPAAPSVYRLAMQPQQTEPQAYLGVSATPVSEEVRAHVGEMPKGVGLTVGFIDPEGPAAGAGLKLHDVLVRLDDQLLINAEQLTVLVRMREEGEEVTLTVMRAGEEQEIKVTLGEKELPVAQPQTLGWAPATPGARYEVVPVPQLNLEMQPFFQGNLTPEYREQIERLTEEAAQRLREQGMGADHPQMRELAELMRQRQAEMMELQRGVIRPLRQGLASGGRLQINNDDMSLNMVNEDGEISLRVTDADGEVLYEGDFPDREALSELPAEAREILEQARRYLPEDHAEAAREEQDEADEAAEEEQEEQSPSTRQRVRI